MSFLQDHLNRSARATPQMQPMTGEDTPIGVRQVKNAAGGYVFPIDKWEALDRFLVLGTMGGTYYASEKKITEANLAGVAELLAEDGQRVVARVIAISMTGRAQKQDYGLAVLAMALSYKSQVRIDAFARKNSHAVHTDGKDGENDREANAYFNEVRTKRAAYAAISQVCRTGSTLFQLLSYLKGRRKISGRGLETALAKWYNDRPVDQLAYQMVKYGQRHGYTHRDVLRLAHPNPNDAATPLSGDGNALDMASETARRMALYKWGVGKETLEVKNLLPALVNQADAAKYPAASENKKDFARVLPREALPTEWLNDPAAWEALLYGDGLGHGMPLGALVRNLGNLSKHEVLVAGSDATRYVVGELMNMTRLQKARIHPISLYIAMKTYVSGQGLRGSGVWAPVGEVVDALSEAFYLAMGNVEPSGKRLLIGLDVSGSMSNGRVLGIQNCTPIELAAAMALVHVRTEPIAPVFLPFDGRPHQFAVSADEKLDRLATRLGAFRGGATDCALPIGACAMAEVTPEVPDACVIYTDGETWVGRRHVTEALRDARYRNPRFKLVTAGTTATGTTLADPQDPLTFGVSGFDAGAPDIISGFIKGDL